MKLRIKNVILSGMSKVGNASQADENSSQFQIHLLLRGSGHSDPVTAVILPGLHDISQVQHHFSRSCRNLRTLTLVSKAVKNTENESASVRADYSH